MTQESLSAKRIRLARELFDTPLGREFVKTCIQDFQLMTPTDAPSKEATEEIRYRKDQYRDLLFAGRTDEGVLSYLSSLYGSTRNKSGSGRTKRTV